MSSILVTRAGILTCVLQICAEYFAGTITGCYGYPNQIYNAPYYCAIQIGDLLTSLGVPNNLQHLKGKTVRQLEEEEDAPLTTEEDLPLTTEEVPPETPGEELTFEYVNEQYRKMNSLSAPPLPFNPANISLNGSTIIKYLKSNMTQNCQKRCFQRYISQANLLFAGNCRAEVYKAGNQANYKFLRLLSMYQEFRNQVCVENPNPQPGVHANCFSSITSLGGSSSSVSNIADSPLFSLTCQYNFNGIPDYVIQSVLAGGVAKLGCCFGNLIGMLTQNPLKPPPIIFPPCLLRYFSVNAKMISPSTYCTHKANGNMTVFEFNMNITNPTGGLPPVNVYDETSLLILQGVIIGVLSINTTITSTLPPDTLNPLKPYQPEVVNYLYYKGGELLTPSNGYTNTSDYPHSNKVALTVLLVFEGFTSPNQIASISQFIETPSFATYLSLGFYKVYQKNYLVTVATQNHVLSRQYLAEPIQLSASSAFSVFYIPLFVIAVGTFLWVQ